MNIAAPLYFSSLIIGTLFLLNLPRRRWRESIATGLSIVASLMAIVAIFALFRAVIMLEPHAFRHLAAYAVSLPIATPGAGVAAILAGLVCGLHDEIHGWLDRATVKGALRQATPSTTV